MLLMQNDPFRDLDLFLRGSNRTEGPNSMPMDAYRRGEDVWVHIDLPGVTADAIEVDVERSVLTISAERSWHREEGDHLYLNERHSGSFRRQVHLGDSLDPEGIEADCADGVLTIRIPIQAKAKARKISIGGRNAMDVPSIESTT